MTSDMVEHRAPELFYSGGAFFECPRWHEGRWWVSDFQQHRVVSLDTSGEGELVMTVDAQPSGLGWLPDGSMLVVSMKDHTILRRSTDGRVEVYADLAGMCNGHLNDMVVDAQGRAFVGNIGFEVGSTPPAATNLIRVDPDRSATVCADGFWMPNGMVITPDGSTLIVGESLAGRYTAFTVTQAGDLVDRRLWSQVGAAPEPGTMREMIDALNFLPDGCALDAEGLIWSADPTRGRCIRLAPNGEIHDEVRVAPGLGVYACMLGGPDGTTLLLCVAPLDTSRAGATSATLATVEVRVPRAGRP